MDQEAEGMGKVESLGARLGRLMKAKGFNQTTLARRAGIDRTDINRIVNDRREPRHDELAWLAQVLGVTIEDLLTGVEIPEGLRKTLAKVEEAARRVLAAESARDEMEARHRTLEEEFAAAKKCWEAERAQLQHQLEQAAAGVAEAQRRAQEAAQQTASKDLSLGAERATWNSEKAQLTLALRQSEAANQALRAQVEQLQQQLTKEDGKALAAGLLAGLAGLVSGAALQSASSEDDERARVLADARLRAKLRRLGS